MGSRLAYGGRRTSRRKEVGRRWGRSQREVAGGGGGAESGGGRVRGRVRAAAGRGVLPGLGGRRTLRRRQLGGGAGGGGGASGGGRR